MKLVAQREFRYAGKLVKPGDTFEAAEKHGRVLKAARRAVDAKDKEPEAKPAAAPAEPVRAAAGESVEAWQPSLSGFAGEGAPRRRYQRRDVVAED
jgi:hypothetical protein